MKIKYLNGLLLTTIILGIRSVQTDNNELKIEVIDEDGAIELAYNPKDSHILGVSAAKESDDDWYVFVVVAEFIRDEPLESKFRKVVYDSLSKVEGVTLVEEVDREEWMVSGKASGEELIKSCVKGLKSLYPELEAYINNFNPENE